MSDPKQAAGAAKVPFFAIPWAVVSEAALGMGEGAVKYGPHNWRESGGVEAMTYVGGTLRHLVAFVLGEEIDAASGLPHVTKAISSLMVLRDAQINGVVIDNRPPAVPDGFLDAINALWSEVRDRAEAARVAPPASPPSSRPHPHEVLRGADGGRGHVPSRASRSSRLPRGGSSEMRD